MMVTGRIRWDQRQGNVRSARPAGRRALEPLYEARIAENESPPAIRSLLLRGKLYLRRRNRAPISGRGREVYTARKAALSVPLLGAGAPPRVNGFVVGKRGHTPMTAVMLSKILVISPCCIVEDT